MVDLAIGLVRDPYPAHVVLVIENSLSLHAAHIPTMHYNDYALSWAGSSCR